MFQNQYEQDTENKLKDHWYNTPFASYSNVHISSGETFRQVTSNCPTRIRFQIPTFCNFKKNTSKLCRAWVFGLLVCPTCVHTLVPQFCIWWFHTQSDILEIYNRFCSMVSFQLLELLQLLEYIWAVTGAKYLKRQASYLAVETSFLCLLSILLRLGLVRR